VTARSFAEATQKLSDQTYDIVLADYNLGAATGTDLYAHWRNLPGCKPASTKFHLITAHAAESIRISSIQTGISGFHGKPIGLPALYRLLVESLPPDLTTTVSVVTPE
jgi:CheY-like chemotaxis protein